MNVTPDEILDSLTRQAQLRERLGESENISFEEIAQIEEARRMGQSSELAPSFKAVRKSRSGRTGRYAFAAMLSGGLAILWGYGIFSKTLDAALLSRIQSLIYQTTFSDPTRVLLIAIIALVAGLLVSRERKRSDLRPLRALTSPRGSFQQVALQERNAPPRTVPSPPAHPFKKRTPKFEALNTPRNSHRILHIRTKLGSFCSFFCL